MAIIFCQVVGPSDGYGTLSCACPTRSWPFFFFFEFTFRCMGGGVKNNYFSIILKIKFWIINIHLSTNFCGNRCRNGGVRARTDRRTDGQTDRHDETIRVPSGLRNPKKWTWVQVIQKLSFEKSRIVPRMLPAGRTCQVFASGSPMRLSDQGTWRCQFHTKYRAPAHARFYPFG